MLPPRCPSAATPLPPLLVEPMPLWRLYFSFAGRIDRGTYWRAGVLGLLGLGLAAVALLRIAGLSAERADNAVNQLLAWPAIAISVKRWHDRDRAGWWVLINVLPLIGWLWAFVDNAFVPGSAQANRFGPPPRSDALL
jgi:uncharacterized membrane protein YhaH (DUF805 family)